MRCCAALQPGEAMRKRRPSIRGRPLRLFCSLGPAPGTFSALSLRQRCSMLACRETLASKQEDTALKTPLQAATHSLRVFGPPVRGRWPLPEGGKLRRSLPAPYLRPPPKKCGAGAHAAPLAPLFWADLHAIASGAPRRGAVIALFGEAVRDPTDGPLCERWAAEAQLSPVCARRRETPTSSRRAHS